MDCDEARPLLPLLTRSDEAMVELRAVRDHLTGCAACQSALETELRSDREMSQRFLAVPVPLELNARLHRDFAALHPVAAPGVSARVSRRRWSTAALIVPVVMLCGFLSLWFLRPSRVPLQEVLTAIFSLEYSAEWPIAPASDRPAGWSQVPGLKVEEARRAPATPVAAQVVQFAFRPARSRSPVIGRLWIMAADEISDAKAIPSLEFSQIQYSPGQPHLVWSEQGAIYLLDASGDVLALEQLQLALRKSRSIA